MFEFDFTKSDSPPKSRTPREAPLAHRMRPASLEFILGHDRILAPGKPLRIWIETDRLPSMIFWGPPGSGKTTLAQIVASATKARFKSLSAVQAGVKELKATADEARQLFQLQNRKTVLFVDEIHRFNKSQQDTLLPHVEDGTLILIGATTENPSFEINRALLSRMRVIRLDRLSTEAIESILKRALESVDQGLGGFLKLTDEALNWIAAHSEGDARRALTALENLSLSTQGILDLEGVQKALEADQARQPIPYDKNGEEHHNVISAFIKSIRDSDPHAGLYYLARMLEGGEDPLFIARRLVIFASEDVGNADPRGLLVAIAAKEAVEFVGLPEGRINLAQAVTYLASAPKSRASYEGIDAALDEVRNTGALPVPEALRNPPLSRVKKGNLPEDLKGRIFYTPTENGLEKQIKEKLTLRQRGLNSP